LKRHKLFTLFKTAVLLLHMKAAVSAQPAHRVTYYTPWHFWLVFRRVQPIHHHRHHHHHHFAIIVSIQYCHLSGRWTDTCVEYTALAQRRAVEIRTVIW